jgi:dihydrofolate reductase
MDISIVVAMAENGTIGREGGLPWHLSSDLLHFKSITMGKPIVMGRLTHESIGRVLPGRENIILTRNRDYEVEGCTVINDLSSVMTRTNEFDEIMLIGGAQLYADALSLATRLYITEVHAQVEGDVSFPEFNRKQWQESEREFFTADDKNEYDFSFVVLKRV